MTSLFDKIREELRGLTRDIVALANEATFRRICDDNGRLVAALVPTEEQRRTASDHDRRLQRWSRMVASIFRRRGHRPGADVIERCAKSFERYVRLSRRDAPYVRESIWRAAFASEVTGLSLDVARVLEENKDAFEIVRRRSALEYDDFDLRLSEIDGLTFDSDALSRALAARDIKTIGALGQALFEGAFNGFLRDTATQPGRGVRIRLHPDGNAALAAVPWELLHDGQQFLALNGQTSIVRCVDGAESMSRPLDSAPLRILLTLSSPKSFPFLDVQLERDRLEAAVAPLVMLGLVKLDVAADGSMNTLRRMLRSADEIGQPYHAWHFIGHGRYDESAGRGDLVLSDERNEPQFASGWELGPLFKAHRDLQFACLNACKGALWERGKPISGASTSLIQAGVPSVIAMQFAISDEAAIVFAEELYGALADGAALENAVAEGRRGIFYQPNPAEWITPVLFVSGSSENAVLPRFTGQTKG